MAESSCVQVFIGFESLSQDSLNSMNKGKINVSGEFMEAINTIQSHKISVFGSFILGYDGESIDIFDRTIDFINQANLGFVSIQILVPFPGTPLHRRLQSEGRLIPAAWDQFDGWSACFRPKNMSTETLEEGYRHVLQEIYSYESLSKRLNHLWENGLLVIDNPGPSASERKSELLRKAGNSRYFTSHPESLRFLSSSLMNEHNPRFFSILSAIDFHQLAYESSEITENGGEETTIAANRFQRVAEPGEPGKEGAS